MSVPIHVSERSSYVSERSSYVSERSSYVSERSSHVSERSSYVSDIDFASFYDFDMFRRCDNPVLSSFTTYHRVCNMTNIMGATNGAVLNCLPFRTHELTPSFSGFRVAQSLVFCVVFCISLFVLFLLVIALSVLVLFTTSDSFFFVSSNFSC
jgi:hypothetical protein